MNRYENRFALIDNLNELCFTERFLMHLKERSNACCVLHVQIALITTKIQGKTLVETATLAIPIPSAIL